VVEVGDIGVGGGASGQLEAGRGVSSSEEEASSSQESGAGALGFIRAFWEEMVREEREESRSCRLRSATLMVMVGRLPVLLGGCWYSSDLTVYCLSTTLI